MSDDELPEARASTSLGVRLLWAAIAVLVLVLVIQVASALRGEPSSTMAEPLKGELSVNDALSTATRRRVAVRGYVFTREGFPPQLCSGIHKSRPPRCYGPSLTLEGLDLSRLDLKSGSDEGTPVGWIDEPVALLGTLNAALMRVQEVLR